MKKRPTIFLCHSSNDKPFVRKLADNLERFGLRVWLDEKDIKVGMSIRESIESGMKNSDYLLIVLSKSSINKEWVKKELNAAFALEAEKKTNFILPVIVEKIKLPIFLKDKKYADFTNSFERGFDEIIDTTFPEYFHASVPALETISCEVYINIAQDDGKIVNYKKIQKVKAKINDIDSYTEAFSADGKMSDLKSSTDVIGEIRTESGSLYINTVFSKKLKKDESYLREFEFTFNDSFTSNNEYWEQRQDYPTKKFKVFVLFSHTRPPASWEILQKVGALTKKSKHIAKKISLYDRPTLVYEVQNPSLFDGYIIKWKW